MAFESLLIYEHSDSLVIGNIFLICIAIIFILSWVMFWYFISHKQCIQLSSISISSLVSAISLSFGINVLYYVLHNNIDEIIYGILTFFVLLLYSIGHIITITSFLWNIKLSLSHYNRSKYYNTLVYVSFLILPIPLFTLCIIVIIKSSYFTTVLFNIWILTDSFLTLNLIYLYLTHLSFFYIKYNTNNTYTKDTKNNIISNHDLQTMIRNTWNISLTLILSIICMICIVIIKPPFHNLSHLLICINMFIHILCIISFIDYNPYLLNKICLIGDIICNCNTCCKKCITISLKNEYSNGDTGNKIYNHHTIQHFDEIQDAKTIFRHKQVLGLENNDNINNNKTNETHKIIISRWDTDDSDNGNNQDEKHMLLDSDICDENDIGELKQNNNRNLLCGESLMEYNDKWLHLIANTFNIRPKDYYTLVQKKRKGAKKIPSKQAMYDVFAVDGYQMNEKLKFIDVIKKYNIDIKNIINTNKNNKLYLPYLVIINIILPINAKKNEIEFIKGNGIQITLYAKLSNESLKILNDYKNNNDLNKNLPESMELFSKFINGVNNNNNKNKIKDNDIENALKITMRVNNLSDSSLPFVMKKLVKKGNGQSLVIKYKERATFYLDKLKEYFIIDIDGYTLSKQVLSMWNTAKSNLDSIIYDIAFHIGGHSKNNLPEQILLCTQINKLSIKDMILINEMKMKPKQSNNVNLNINDNQQRRVSYMYTSDKDIIVSSPSPSPGAD